MVVIDAILGFPGGSSTIVEHLGGLLARLSGLDVASLLAGPQALMASRLRSASGWTPPPFRS